MAKTLIQIGGRIWYDTVDPGLSETQIVLGDSWINTSSGEGFSCADTTLGAQVWNRSLFVSPLSSSLGGTGVSGLTDHAILVGSGTAAVTPITVGTTGQVLAGSTGADPAFTATPSLTSITLNGGTAFANYLEQQSFTPTISGATSAGTGTYTTQAGYYTRVGNMIYIQGQIVWTAHTGTGDMLLTNLPFTCRNSANFNPEIIANAISIPLPGAATSIRCEIQPGTTQATLSVIVNDGSNSPVQMNATGTVHFAGWFLT